VKWFNDDRGFGFITPDNPYQGRRDMASSGKKKTTMAKLARENRLRERRRNKQAKKDARKRAPADHAGQPGHALIATTGEPARPGAGQPALETVDQALADVP
jgi:hypothetical protein